MKELLAFLIGLAFFVVIALVVHYVPLGDTIILIASMGLLAWGFGTMIMAAWEMRKKS